MYHAVPRELDFPSMERRLLRFWDETRAFDKLVLQLQSSQQRFSFIDGPITANNPMGVHHAWGRTYKDLYQRYKAMTGHTQRWQNGFDCQGLWVEVEVEKELGFTTKRDIEQYGIDEFVQRCKERVLKFARVQTEQSIRLGYWMDWGNSYYTMSDENNFTIWQVLKRCFERGWLYRGHDVMPWCPRCGTGISQHEIDTEGYAEVTHTSLYVRLPLDGRPHESLLVWTTTPWTLSANVAAAVHPDLPYIRATREGESVYLAESRLGMLGPGWEVAESLPGSAMLGWRYRGPFDELSAWQDVAAKAAENPHRIIAWTDVSAEEGTGIVHIAPGCGEEDFVLGKELGLPVLAPIDDQGDYVQGFGWLTGHNTRAVPALIADDLSSKGVLFRSEPYRHRYPHCWRCRTELVFRLVDEWYISMQELRPLLMAVTRQIRWIPEFGLDRELDWLANMHDWMISKKRYWGLALPIWVCESCRGFDVIGSEADLKERAVEGWAEFEGHSPHRPWVDRVKIRCGTCGGIASRIPDVGNPWLDAGIVAYSTLNYRNDRQMWEQWFPADFITESFPGQYRNWFYAMLVMSTVLENRPPTRAVLGFATLRDEQGRPMHKSQGNSIEFNEAAETVGADVLRWVYSRQTPTANLNFGWNLARETKRELLTLWNSYKFFVTYARTERWKPGTGESPPEQRPEMDRWLLGRLHQLTGHVRERLDDIDQGAAARAIQGFFEDLSNWYIQVTRDRFWAPGSHADRNALATLYEALVTLARLMAPFMPFLAEEMYQNLVRAIDPEAPESVHHCSYPEADVALIDETLLDQMARVRTLVSLGNAARKGASIPVRRPLPALRVSAHALGELPAPLVDVIKVRLNVKVIDPVDDLSEAVRARVDTNPKLLGPKYGSDYPRLKSLLRSGQFTVGDDGRVRVVFREAQDERLVVLEKDEAAVVLEPAPGFAAAVEKDVLVVLDTAQTPELVAEGRAREVVRVIQDARKAADFDVADRILVSFRAPDDLALAVEAHAEYVRRETLATALTRAPDGLAGHTAEDEIDGMPVAVSVRRASGAGA